MKKLLFVLFLAACTPPAAVTLRTYKCAAYYEHSQEDDSVEAHFCMSKFEEKIK